MNSSDTNINLNAEKIKKIINMPVSSAVVSQRKKQAKTLYTKVVLKPFKKGNDIVYQFSCYENKKVFHKNLNSKEAGDYILELLSEEFEQCVIFSQSTDYHITAFNGKIKIKSKQKEAKEIGAQDLSHNRSKNYVITAEEGADFLYELGILGKNGEIKHDKYAKFKQINRYLEFIADIKDSLPKDKTIKIVDFGCGKAYLSFALYYYLVKKLKLKAEIIGLDLKEDVIKTCQTLADKLGYNNLIFKCGDIGTYSEEDPFDMVISLHACDTATDEALYKGIIWKSKVILAVPCCQHELNPQVENESNEGILRFGLLKERLSSIITDSYRALLLESVGYKCDIAEFIDLSHTPKNLLIRAVFTNKANKKSLLQAQEIKKQWQFEQRLETLLKQNKLL